MKQNERYVSLEEIVNALKKKEKTFRKTNGAKYTGDFSNSIKATLRTSGLFIKNNEGKYFYKEKIPAVCRGYLSFLYHISFIFRLVPECALSHIFYLSIDS